MSVISDFAGRIRISHHRNNLVICAVERGADQVVHGGVDYQESLAVIALAVDHRGQQDSGGPDDGAAGLEQQANVETTQRRGQRLRIRSDLGGEFLRVRLFVGDAQSAAGVDVVDLVAVGAQFADQIRHARHRFAKGGDVGDLRADVNADAAHFQISGR